MIAKLVHLLPSASSAASKLVQLALLAAVSNLAPEPLQAPAIVAFVLLGTMSQLTDSGGLAYLLVHHEASRNATSLRIILGTQALTVGLGLLVGIAITTFAVGLDDLEVLVTLVIISIAQLIDGLARLARSVLLIDGESGRFVIPEVASTIGRVAVIVVAWAASSFSFLSWVLLPAAFSLWLSWLAARRSFVAARPHVRIREILAFGVSGLTSSYATQAPLLLASVLLPASAVAPFSMAYRVAQAAEFLPSTIAQQLLPRFSSRPSLGRRYISYLFLLGVAVAIGIWSFRGLLGDILAFPPGTAMILGILLWSLPFRFANHAALSLSFALKLIRLKTIVSLVAGGFASAIVLVASLHSDSVLAAVFATVLVEAVQLCGLTVVNRRALRSRT